MDGLCVYEGLPTGLRQCLKRAGIEFNKDQIPIEVIIKICSASPKDNADESSKHLAQMMMQKRFELEQKCRTQGHITNGITQKSLRFHFRHFWYLLFRSLSFTINSHKKILIGQFALIFGFSLAVTQIFNRYVGSVDGCFTPGTNRTCNETEELLKEETLLRENKNLEFVVIMVCITTTGFASIFVFCEE